MKILIFGDIHGKFSAANTHYNAIMQIYKIDIDLFINVGDFGFWPYLNRHVAWPREFPHRCAFVDGNHENHEVLLTLNKENWGMSMPPSEEWKRTLSSWEYKPRGTIEDGILYIGGAKSLGPNSSMRGIDWFPEENISYRDQETVFQAIEEYGPKNIHTVISHDCPGSFNVSAACVKTGFEIIDGNRKFLEAVRKYVRPQRWYFGHYHKAMSGQEEETYWRCLDRVRGGDNDDFVIVDLP